MMLFPNETFLFQCICYLEIVPLRPRVIMALIFLNVIQQPFYVKLKINKFYLEPNIKRWWYSG